jgi:tripartite-type tricarboxylate transporter receptor subunit TctC
VDVAARAMAQQLTKTWRQPVVIDNRPGAGTILGGQALASATADGHTFAWVLAAHATNPSLYRKLPYDTLQDFAGVTLLYSLRSMITAAPGFAPNNVNELIALAKAKPGELTFTSPQPGTIPHLLGELFKRKHHLQIEHIGYKGSVAAHTDVMAGRVNLMFDVLPNALPQIRAGRLKAIAMIGDTPAKELPNVPVLTGLLPPKALAGWNGIVVPARTPKDVVNKLNADLITAVRSPEIQERFANLTVDTITNTPQEFDAFIRSEMAFWGEVVRNAGIRLD